MHAEALAFLAAKVAENGPFDRVLDIGGRDVNGSPRRLFPGTSYTALDIMDGPGVDVVADALDWLDPEGYDAVLCCEVLEHIEAPWALLEAAGANLRRGGLLLLTTACDPREAHSGQDGGPLRPGEWYLNVEPDEASGWLADWDALEVEAHRSRGDLYASARRR